jgi:hypothetical protein
MSCSTTTSHAMCGVAALAYRSVRATMGAMPSRAQNVARHIIILIIILIALSAVAIWLGLGPVVHS